MAIISLSEKISFTFYTFFFAGMDGFVLEKALNKKNKKNKYGWGLNYLMALQI